MTSPYHGSKIPGSQQSYGRKVLATLENTVIIFLSPPKNILHSHCSFSFFRGDSKSQEKLKTIVMQNFGADKRIIMVFSKVANGLLVKFRILMLYNHDVIRLQQKPNISSTRFSGLPTLVTEHAWYCGMSNT